MSAAPRMRISVVLLVLSVSLPGRADDADKAAVLIEGKGAKLERDLKIKDKPVIRAHLARAAINDDDLALLAKFEWLETLDLSDTPITDAGLVHLQDLKKLTKLDLTHTNTFGGLADLKKQLPNLAITHPLATLAASAKERPEAERKSLALLSRYGAAFKIEEKAESGPVVRVVFNDTVVYDTAIAALSDLPGLRALDLALCPLTEVDLTPLQKLEKLQELNLYNCKVRDEALEPIKDLKQLRTLNLAYNPITDKAIAELKGLNQLRTLVLFRTKVTDEGLKHLAAQGRLEVLSLSGTGVTDAGLDALKGMASLREISLAETKVTSDGVEALKKALPSVKVRR